MDLAMALSKPAIGRAPSEERLENQTRFLDAWRLLVERQPADGPDPSFLSFLSEQDALRLSDMGRQQTLQKGHKIYARGDRAFFLGLVLQGTCVQTEMQDLRFRPQTRGSTRAAGVSGTQSTRERGQRDIRSGSRAGTAPAGAQELHQGDTFGEIPLALDGQLVGGRRESTLHAADDDQVEHVVFTVDYKKFASFMQALDTKGRESSHRQQAPSLTIASRLLPKVLPKSENDAPWLVNKKTMRGDNSSVAASEDFSPSKKKSKILDAPPVTMLNMDVLMECAWTAKRAEGVVSETTRAILGSETRMPHTVVFRDGEPVHWYVGWMSGLKRRSKEHLTTWHLLEDFCKGTDAGQLVAIMTCCKRGNAMGTEHAQCRLLDKRKLERVLSGAKSNRLTGYIQKYHRVETLATATEYVLQCCWSNNSFTVDWVPETMVECLSHVHKPSRMDPGGLKKLHEKMNCRYHQYVSGTLSTLGDYFNSSTIKMNPLTQLDGRSKARARQFNDGTDAKAGNIVEREIRDTVKTACQQIASTFDKILNKSASARNKAIEDASQFNLNHNPAFTLISTMNCFFKVNKEGLPSLLHCTAAVAHTETKQPLTQLSRAELLKPSEQTFLFFAGYGAEHSRLSGLGERAVLLDFSEFLQLLTKKELLYEHVSITDASLCFKQACHSLNAEEGQLKFPEYCECMRLLRARMGLDDSGNPKYLVRVFFY
jgi:predicted GIY-YIG superfamily endonuclease/CRP-like cAMP-binding protein